MDFSPISLGFTREIAIGFLFCDVAENSKMTLIIFHFLKIGFSDQQIWRFFIIRFSDN